jgi:hypothetical protein
LRLIFLKEEKMRKGLFAIAILAFAMAGAAQAAAPGDEVPFREGEPMPPAPPGRSWCLIQKPAVYDNVTETVTVRPPANFQVPVPGTYSTKTETIPCVPAYKVGKAIPAQIQPKAVPYVCQEEYKVLELVPPQFADTPIDVEICPAYEQITIIPAQFRDVPKRLVVEPARKEFQRVACDDGNLCWTVCETPAKYRDVITKELVSDAKEQRVTVPAKKQQILVKKLVKPASVREVTVPAKQATYQANVVAAPARVEWQTIPAQSQTVPVLVETKAPSFSPQAIPEKKETITRRVLKSPASMVWRLQSNSVYAGRPIAVAPVQTQDNRQLASVPASGARYSLK